MKITAKISDAAVNSLNVDGSVRKPNKIVITIGATMYILNENLFRYKNNLEPMTLANAPP